MPTPGDMHVNAPLTNISVAYLQEQTQFVATRVFPVVPVQKQSDRYFLYSKGDLMRSEAMPRAPGTESAGVDYDIDNTPNYACQKLALHLDVDDDQVANADSPLRPEQDAARILTHKMLIKRDQQFADSYFKTGVWETDWDGVAAAPGANEFIQWDAADSHPIKDVRLARRAVGALTGHLPNVGVIGPDVFDVLCDHADIIDRYKHTSAKSITAEMIASLFLLEELLVAEAVHNTAVKGQAVSMANIFGKHLLLAFAQRRPALMAPSAGYCFSWAGLYGAGNDGLRTKRIPAPLLNSNRIENEMAYDMKVVAADCGAFLEDAIG